MREAQREAGPGPNSPGLQEEEGQTLSLHMDTRQGGGRRRLRRSGAAHPETSQVAAWQEGGHLGSPPHAGPQFHPRALVGCVGFGLPRNMR